MNQITEIAAEKPLNPKHRLVADNWLRCGNATQAAIDAGYSPRSARVQAGQILSRPEIKAYLARANQELENNEEQLRGDIVKELKKIGFSNVEDYTRLDEEGNLQVDFTKATREQLASVQRVTTKKRRHYNKGELVAEDIEAAFTLYDKQRALDTLAKVTGLLRSDEMRVTVDVADRLLAARGRVRELAGGEVTEIEGEIVNRGGGGTGV